MTQDHYGEQSISVRRQGDEVALILSLEAADILAEFLDHRDPLYATSWQRVGVAVQSAAHRLGVYSEPQMSRSQFLRARWLHEVPGLMDLSLPLLPVGPRSEPPSVVAVAPSPVAVSALAVEQYEAAGADEVSSAAQDSCGAQDVSVAQDAGAEQEAELTTLQAAELVRAAVVTAAATAAAAARASKAARAGEATSAAVAVADVVSRAAAAVQADADHQAAVVAALAASTAAAVALQVLPGHELEERRRASVVAASTADAAVETARVTALAAARVAEAAAKAACDAAVAARDAAIILELEVDNAAQKVQYVADRAAVHVGAVHASAADLLPVVS